MDIKRLADEDAAIYKASLGTAEVGDGTSDLDDLVGGGVGSGAGWWRIVTKASSGSGLPDALEVKDFFYDDGATIIMAVGDTASQATLTEICYLTSLSVSNSKNEIETTTLCDTAKSYRSGKSDLTGSFEGVRSVGGTASQIADRNAFISQFMTVITDDGAGNTSTSWAKTDPNDTLLWIFAKMYETTTTDEIETVAILPIRLTSLDSIGITLDDRQNLNGSFRVDGSENPQEYQRTVA